MAGPLATIITQTAACTTLRSNGAQPGSLETLLEGIATACDTAAPAVATALDVLANDLAVMDAAAISLARENHLPIVVFNIHAPGAFAQVMRGEGRFTRIVEAQ